MNIQLLCRAQGLYNVQQWRSREAMEAMAQQSIDFMMYPGDLACSTYSFSEVPPPDDAGVTT